MKKILTFFVVLFIFSQHILAVTAYPYPIESQLPDGTTITVTLKGDEKIHWATSEDGYTLLRNSEGYYEYAILDEYEDLVCSGVRAYDINIRSSEEVYFLQTVQKDLRFSKTQREYLRSLWDFEEEFYTKMNSKGTRDFIGEVRAPLVLMGFPDKPFQKTKEDFDLLMNQPNYYENGNKGSVYDYFYDCSYNLMEFNVDVFGPFTTNNGAMYYVNNTGNMIREAVIAADADGCDFSLYDIDNDGYVDGIHVIFAGHGDESINNGQQIWSHKSAINPYYVDGKYVSVYSCSPELRGSSGTNMTYIGVIAHELSHVFGIPDFYDTDQAGSGGEAVDLGNWDIMAGGSWNDSGRKPPYHNPWSRSLFGWIDEIVLNSPQEITIPNPEEMEKGVVYRINTKTNNEYFLLENRQKLEWDAYIPGSGLLIFHVDRNYSGWNNNRVNANPNHRGLYIKQANGGPNSDANHGGNTPYPISTNKEFNDTSVPNSKSWAGANTEVPITDIAKNTALHTVFFRVMGFPAQDCQLTVTASPEIGGTATGSGTYPSSTEVILTATPNEGFVFYVWKINDQIVWTRDEYTFEVTTDIEVVAEFLSSVSTLSDIIVSKGSLSPAFNPEVKDYTVNVPITTTEISITGIPTCENATVAGNLENEPIAEGINKFKLTVTAENDSKTTYNVNVNRGGIGVENIENQNIRLYPNPANNFIVIETETSIDNLQVYDINGKLIDFINNVSDTKLSLDLSNYSSGIYFIKTKNQTLKFIKE